MKHIEKAVDYKTIHVSSKAFDEAGFIPAKYTCDGINISPPIDLDGIPKETKSLAIIVDDPDAPVASWTHWLVWNIPVTHQLLEGVIHGIQGINDFQKNSYSGPCPPSSTHRYFFKVYALDAILDLPPTTKKIELERAMSTQIIGFGELMGMYSRTKQNPIDIN